MNDIGLKNSLEHEHELMITQTITNAKKSII